MQKWTITCFFAIDFRFNTEEWDQPLSASNMIGIAMATEDVSLVCDEWHNFFIWH